MKLNKTLCALIAITIGAQFVNTACNNATCANISSAIMEEPGENEPVNGMFFSVEYVTEEFVYDDAYAIRYTDPDAGFEEAEILLDRPTYEAVLDAVNDNHEMVGMLVLNESESRGDMRVYTFMENPEFEMANASSKI